MPDPTTDPGDPTGPTGVPRAAGPHVLVASVADEVTAVVVAGDDARHLAVVLRARSGDPVSVADGSGTLWQGRVTAASPQRVDIDLVEHWDVPVPTPRLTVVHGLAKGRKLDDVVRMLSELGVDRLIPVRTSRSEVRPTGPAADKVRQRWQAVAHAAAKQSRRVRPLVVEPITDWPGTRAPGVAVWEQATEPLGTVLDALDAPDEVVLAVGAEGGLTPGEVRASGWASAALGTSILRTETAAVVSASIVLHRLGRLG